MNLWAAVFFFVQGKTLCKAARPPFGYLMRQFYVFVHFLLRRFRKTGIIIIGWQRMLPGIMNETMRAWR